MKSAVAPFLPNFRNISPDFLLGRPIQAVLLPIFDPITHSLPASQRVKRPKMTNAQVCGLLTPPDFPGFRWRDKKADFGGFQKEICREKLLP